jgi:excisionase family DNA binding protein
MVSPISGSADRILRVHTIAKLLGCSPRTVRRRIQNHVELAIRIGRRAWGVRASKLGQLAHNVGGDYDRN